MFVNGDLKGKFIMDRNLGARDTKRAVDAKGVLMYQFGRKDPFPGGISALVTPAYIDRDNVFWSLQKHSGPVDVSTSVMTPIYFYSVGGSNWCSGVDSESYIWNDFEKYLSSNGKSIFDPSPLGWKISAYGTMSGFSTETMTDWVSSDDYIGCSYPRESPFAHFNAQGMRVAGSATLTYFSTHASLWTSTPYNSISSYAMHFNDGSYNISRTGESRALARSVRCVQHYE